MDTRRMKTNSEFEGVRRYGGMFGYESVEASCGK
jgi:hypothetical protein